MNKTSPVWAFISAANPFSGRFQVFNFQYEPRRARGRFLARFTYLNRISIQGNELELASFPNFAATLTVFTKTAHVKEGIHTPSSLKKKVFRLSRGCTLYRRVPGRVKCPNFPLAEIGWLPLAETDLRRPGTDLEPDLSDPGEPGDDKMRVGKLETTETTSRHTQDAPHKHLG